MAAAGANFLYARLSGGLYQIKMYVSEPTGHLVHIAKSSREWAGYKRLNGGNNFLQYRMPDSSCFFC